MLIRRQLLLIESSKKHKHYEYEFTKKTKLYSILRISVEGYSILQNGSYVFRIVDPYTMEKRVQDAGNITTFMETSFKIGSFSLLLKALLVLWYYIHLDVAQRPNAQTLYAVLGATYPDSSQGCSHKCLSFEIISFAQNFSERLCFWLYAILQANISKTNLPSERSLIMGVESGGSKLVLKLRFKEAVLLVSLITLGLTCNEYKIPLVPTGIELGRMIEGNFSVSQNGFKPSIVDQLVPAAQLLATKLFKLVPYALVGFFALR